MSRASRSTARRPTEPFIDIGEGLSALASEIIGSPPSRPMSPESTSDSKDEVFVLPCCTPIRPHNLEPPSSTSSDQVGVACAQAERGQVFIRDASPTSSDAPIPHITPTPIRERHDPPTFAVTSRPISHATKLSVMTLTTLDTAIAETNNKQGRRPAGSGAADQAGNDQQRHSQQQQQQPGPLGHCTRRMQQTLNLPALFCVVLAIHGSPSSKLSGRIEQQLHAANPHAMGASSALVPPGGLGLVIRGSHGPPDIVDSSDEEAFLRNCERKAEEKCKERQRSEAKAVIELGRVINGTGPAEDEDDGCQPMNLPPRMGMEIGVGMNCNVPFPCPVPPMGLQV
ncbi:hypothetical protein V8E53_015888 [Lactarius tabidus]